jgi:nucleoside-diphosphate-sugar epimerase
MRIFLTGGTGYVGSAVLDALVRAGHHVTALVRHSEKAATVVGRGAEPLVGSLDVPSSYSSAAGHDVYVHAAEDSGRTEELDRLTIESLIALARQSPESLLIYTSGTWVLGDTHGAAAEDAPLNPAPSVVWRPAHEQMVLDAAGNGLRTAIVRPGIVYGGSRGIIGDMLKDARNGLMRVIGTGENHWPLVYDRDLGDLYARIVSRPDASGVYHANDEGDEQVNQIVEAIAVHPALTPDVRHVPLAEARKKLGEVADALVLDQIVRSPRARELGWGPTLKGVARNAARLLEEWRTGNEAA